MPPFSRYVRCTAELRRQLSTRVDAIRRPCHAEAMPRRRQRRKDQGQRHANDIVWDLVRTRVGREAFALARIRAAWPAVTQPGGVSAPTSWPSRIDGDALVLDVTNSQWLHELRYYEADLLARAREACPELGLERIVLRVAKEPIPALPRPDPPPPPPTRQPPVLHPEPPRETMDALLRVHDLELRNALATARLVLGRSRPGDPIVP